MLQRAPHQPAPRKIAVVGSGISGLSAAWLLSQTHDVSLLEADERIGGHSNTVIAMTERGPVPVDTGFIVYNTPTYPNLTALFEHIGVETQPTEMSFAVSLDQGKLEYSGADLNGLFVQRSNLFRPRFHGMIRDLLRFYRQAPRDLPSLGDETLEHYLDRNRYGTAFRDDHLYPMAAAIWSTPVGSIGDYPARSFIRFCENHGLLKITDRPVWRTVKGGSRSYVDRLAGEISGTVQRANAVVQVERFQYGTRVYFADGVYADYDEVVLACHADQALKILKGPTDRERRVLGSFRYTKNHAILHSDDRLMPIRRKAWAAWNYLADRGRPEDLMVTYWMNRLQSIDETNPLFVTLNPTMAPQPSKIHYEKTYEHPVFDQAAMAAQAELWSLQGEGGVWYCGAYFGAGFHEDGLQAGLAVAEAIGDVRRPWTVENESGRIMLPEVAKAAIARSRAA